jgi:hypothetical protein
MSYIAYVYPAGEGPPRVYRRDGILQVLTLKGRSFQLAEARPPVLIYREVI